MKVYHPDHRDFHIVTACPAAHLPAASHAAEWKDGADEPLTFHARFYDGVAEVPDHLGKYLISQGAARRTPPLLRAFG